MTRAVVSALLGLLAASPAAAQLALHGSMINRGGDHLDSAYVEAVVRVDIENGPSAVLPALAKDTTLLLPLRQFSRLAEMRIEAFAQRDSAVIVLASGNVRLRFLPQRHILERGGAPVPYDTMDVVWWDGDMFIASTLLDRLLGTSTRVEWTDLSAMIGRSASLPVVLRERRERRRQQLRREPMPLNVMSLPLRERAVDGAVMSWSFTAASNGPSEQASLDLGFGAGLYGGSAELRPQFWSANGESSAQLKVSWTRAWEHSKWIRQAGVGDIQSNGRHARLIQGFTLTNAPFVRSSEFDVEQFVGTVPQGWEVELYDRGQLLAYADADALGAFRVPIQLRYGQNPFDLVLYGPGGETISRKRTIRVPFSRLPSGHFEYAVAGGRCRYEECDGLFSADARYGLTRHLTLQSGFDAITGTRGGLWQPYAIVSASPLAAIGLSGEAVLNGQVRATAEYEPSMDLRVSGGLTRFSKTGAMYTNGTFLEAERSEASLYWRPGWMNGMLFFRGELLHSSGPDLHRSLGRVSASTRRGFVRYGLGMLVDASRSANARSSQFVVDASADAYLPGPWQWLRSSNVQAQLAFDPARGLTALRTSLGRRVSQKFRADAAVGWFRTAGLSLELSMSTALPGPRVGARSRVSTASGSDALMYAYGSLAYDPRSRVTRLGDGSDLGRAGIRGELFRDDNGNGVRDAGEPGLAGIPVHIGGWRAETDAQGRFSAWGLFPFEPADIEIDSLAFGDPRFVLPAQVLRVRPVANSFGTIAVPVVVGAEVSGFVVLRDEALSGVPVVLRELNTGAEITIITFADGAFYRAAVPPGEYEVTLPDAVLARLHASAPPLSIFVPPGMAEKRYEDLQLRLVPSP